MRTGKLQLIVMVDSWHMSMPVFHDTAPVSQTTLTSKRQ